MRFSSWRTRTKFVLVMVFVFFLFSGFCFDAWGVRWCIVNGECQRADDGNRGGGGGSNPTPTAVPTATNTPMPTPTPSDQTRHYTYQFQLGYYSYDSQDIDCWGLAGIKDPITMVLSIHVNTAADTGQPPSPSEHVAHHGWDYPASTDQNFRQYGDECLSANWSLATDNGADRWHARGLVQSDENVWAAPGTWVASALTPHYDAFVYPCGHAVPQDYDGIPWNGDYSGFSVARDELTALLLESGHHVMLLESSNWSNRQAIAQNSCVDWEPQSDGYVYVLTICDFGTNPDTEDC